MVKYDRKKLVIPLFVWLLLLFLTTLYLYDNLYSPKDSIYLLETFVLLIVIIGIYRYRVKAGLTLKFVLLVSIFYLLICFLYQMAAIILIIGLFPLILADYYLFYKKKPTTIVVLTIILFGYTFLFLDFFFHLVNTLISVDAIILLTSILVYYSKLIRQLIEEREKNQLLNRQMNQAYHGLEKMVVARERNSFATLLHDTATQDLIAVSVQLESINGQIDELEINDLRKKISKVKNFADDSQRNLRKSIANLKLMTDKVKRNEEEILQPIISSFEQKYNLQIIYASSKQNLRLKAALEISKILTECLNNVVRHSKSEEVVVVSKIENDRYKLIVTDFGIGMQKNTLHQKVNLGLESIRNSVRDMGGISRISSSPGEGTSIIVELPKEVATNG